MLENLPIEIVREIMYHLPASDILNMSTTSHEIHSITDDILFWQHLASHHDNNTSLKERITCQLKILQLNCKGDNPNEEENWQNLSNILWKLVKTEKRSNKRIALEFATKLNAIHNDPTSNNVEAFKAWCSENLANRYKYSKLIKEIMLFSCLAIIGTGIASLIPAQIIGGDGALYCAFNPSNVTTGNTTTTSFTDCFFPLGLFGIAVMAGITSLPCCAFFCLCGWSSYRIIGLIKEDEKSQNRQKERLYKLSQHNFIDEDNLLDEEDSPISEEEIAPNNYGSFW